MIEPQTLFIKKPHRGRRFVISDVHGCSKTFKVLLKKIKLQKEDQLFLLGDMVNKGPNSHKVLNRIIKLKNSGHQVYFIRGNHEQIILNTLKKSAGQQKRILKNHGSLCLLKNEEIPSSYKNLLNNSSHYIELEDYWLVHAGFNDKAENPLIDTFSMLNIRVFNAEQDFLKNKPVIFGHTPQSLSDITENIKKSKRKICIDNGCVNCNTPKQGKLVCLELKTQTMFVQKNLDF